MLMPRYYIYNTGGSAMPDWLLAMGKQIPSRFLGKKKLEEYLGASLLICY